MFARPKHDSPRISTVRGTQINCKQLSKMHPEPILVKREFASNSSTLSARCDNHRSSNIVTKRGMRSDGRRRQSAKQDLSIVGSLIYAALSSGTSNINVVIAQPRKHDRTTFRIEKGRQSKFSEDSAKHNSQIPLNWDPDSNTSDSIVACWKQARPIVVTDEGI